MRVKLVPSNTKKHLDCWIGIYWNKREQILYFAPLPMLTFAIELKQKQSRAELLAREGPRICECGGQIGPVRVNPDSPVAILEDRCNKCGRITNRYTVGTKSEK